MWMPPRTRVPPFRSALNAAGTISPAGAKMMAASSFSGGSANVSPARDARHQRLALDLGAAWAGETFAEPPEKLDAAIIHLHFPMPRHLHRKVCRRAKTVKTEALSGFDSRQ